VVKEDVHCIGKALGVKFYNDKANQLRLLSRGRKQKKRKGGECRGRGAGVVWWGGRLVSREVGGS